MIVEITGEVVRNGADGPVIRFDNVPFWDVKDREVYIPLPRDNRQKQPRVGSYVKIKIEWSGDDWR